MSDTSPGETPSHGLLAALLAEQGRRWREGECVPVEALLEAHPTLGASSDAILDLIYNELLLREQRGETPTPEEYRRRFPQLAEALALLFEVDRALQSEPLLQDTWDEAPRHRAGVAGSSLSTGAGPFSREPDRRSVASNDQRAVVKRPGQISANQERGPGPKPVVRPGKAGEINLSDADLRALLHRRLQFGALILLLGIGALHVFRTGPHYVTLVRGGVPDLIWWNWVMCLSEANFLLVAGILFVVLLLRRGISLRGLRSLELVLVAAGATDILVDYTLNLGVITPRWTARWGDIEPVHRLWGLAPYANALDWFATIVGYGLVIPNTWRRCAAVVGTLVACVVLVSVVVFLLADPTQRAYLIGFFGVFGPWLGMAIAVAVFGSHRLETLRQQVQATRQLGQYVLKQRLGAGGMGEVYLAEHRLLKRPCAVKLIRPERTGDPQIFRRFEREVEATTRLNHPNAVQVYDYGHTDDGTFFYAMEYLPGLSLEEVVRREGPLPAGRVVYLLRQVCGALHEAHSVGLIHRDVKPSNIMLCQFAERGDVVKLLDFGLVHDAAAPGPTTRLTQVGNILGTPAFMSPEQGRGETELDPRSDLYSLGATAYFALTGQPPFVRPTAMETLFAHFSEPVPPLTELRGDVPADLQAVVMRSLAKEPADRFADAHSLEKALAGCACAGSWDEEQANAWWQARQKRPPAPEPRVSELTTPFIPTHPGQSRLT
jgi:hypothetical protein